MKQDFEKLQLIEFHVEPLLESQNPILGSAQQIYNYGYIAEKYY